ncbi:DUF433 domain-containing protein [Yinghuangia sp. ASG 101]|uniref:DUF433 domain-containing protein n=1 Tax=Yinghuangia sp. ASG 101 TaxID=2896848 RepID=UPI001E3C2B08|nr:DUF433 domain-containing protein [Yinghuangia sp. ASG 101]UGQ09510.1 DUF433 domain-containing protein [Yinghuangia sp. ASG 101]
MVDKYRDPILTPLETARHLRIPDRTLHRWIHESADGVPLIHAVAPEKRGWASLPFIAVVEAYVLQSLRDLGLSLAKIREAAEAVRREFREPYALATQRICTDGIDIFVEMADGEGIHRARDGQRPIREVISGYLRYITWASDASPQRLRLRTYPDVAPVIIDPRFGWGSPVVEQNKVTVDAIVDLWRSGEPLDVVADEFELSHEQVEAICRTAAA